MLAGATRACRAEAHTCSLQPCLDSVVSFIAARRGACCVVLFRRTCCAASISHKIRTPTQHTKKLNTLSTSTHHPLKTLTSLT